jgi:TATA-box binding protein (TBP) (component of TFIID and TFIIIB)
MKNSEDDKYPGVRPKISNIVASGKFPKKLNIEELYKNLDVSVKEYEPETYPALLVKVKVGDNLRHVTLYKNGKYIIVGVTSVEELESVYEAIYDELRRVGALD